MNQVAYVKSINIEGYKSIIIPFEAIIEMPPDSQTIGQRDAIDQSLDKILDEAFEISLSDDRHDFENHGLKRHRKEIKALKENTSRYPVEFIFSNDSKSTHENWAVDFTHCIKHNKAFNNLIISGESWI